jgi:hypothetical protein
MKFKSILLAVFGLAMIAAGCSSQGDSATAPETKAETAMPNADTNKDKADASNVPTEG